MAPEGDVPGGTLDDVVGILSRRTTMRRPPPGDQRQAGSSRGGGSGARPWNADVGVARVASRLCAHVPILVVLALAIALSAACDNAAGAVPGDGAASPLPTETRGVPATRTPMATSTPVAAGERDGAAGLRGFARQVQAALDARDAAFFRERMKGTDTTCTAADLERIGPGGGPVCTTAGATYRGFLAGRWRSEWETVPAEDALQSLWDIVETAEPSAQDMVGSGQARVHALDVAPGEYRIIATALALRPAKDPHVGPTRVAFSLTAAFEGGKWQLTSLLTAPILGEDLLRPGTEFTSRLTGWELYRP